MNMKSIRSKILFFIVASCCGLLSSCIDDFPSNNGVIPEGDGNINATVTFSPTFIANLGETRTAGNALNALRNLYVLVYSPTGNLQYSYNDEKLNYTITKYDVDKDNDHLDGNEAHTDETQTDQANFKLTDLPYGKYKIYVVANMGDLSTNNNTFKNSEGNTITVKDAIQTESGLKNIKLTWDPDSIELNDQMFGYFTPSTNMEEKGFDAPVLEFNKPEQKIHAWLKRAASKLTIAFDPSGLNEGVDIYIRNVTIRDIPKTCLLGAENMPNSVEELDNHLETPYPEPNYNNTSSAIPNSRFEYDRQGIIRDPDKHTGKSKTDGLWLTKSIQKAIPEGAHAANAQSLFFYENNQDEYVQEKMKGLSETQKRRYDKKQHHTGDDDGVGTPIRDDKEKDDDGNIIKTDLDLKDRVPFGTYVEVEAYYICSNPNNVSEGSIKYRFMLGKDITYNYDAQRNYHFKLTLGFKGWANDPDWHIDYELPNPGIEVPPVFRISYLYYQKSDLPIRILGNCTDLRVDVIENNWAPYYPTGVQHEGVTYPVPPAQIIAPVQDTSDPKGEYNFEWNQDAYFNNWYMQSDNIQYPYYGFLALHLPTRETTIVSKNYDEQPAARNELRDFYNNNQEGWRRFNVNDLSVGDHNKTYYDGSTVTIDDKYEVKKMYNDLNQEIPNQKTLMLPVWTRALTLISDSGFSGNNPYEAFERMARLRITATFPNMKDPIVKEVTVLQVKRITNPKGVWRASDRTDAFDVTLLEAMNSNGRSNFQAFRSEGEWTAYIEGSTNAAGFSLGMNDKTEGYMQNGEVHGYTGSSINFRINFGTSVGDNESECAIVKVTYHNNQCLHKILIRKGYSAPVQMGGKLWSTYSLYQATYRSGSAANGNDVYDAVLTANPLMLGSMFRRGQQTKGIFVSNNMKEDLGPFMPPGSIPFEIGLKNGNNWAKQDWIKIGYRDDCWQYANNEDLGRTRGSRDYGLGTFYVGDQGYRVPTYQDFLDLTNASEYGFGVVYGSEAKGPQYTAEDAYGLIDPQNEGLFDDPRGMRGVIAYDKTTGNQIFFPIGKYGTGRRNNFVLTGDRAGVLRYGDLDVLLTEAQNSNNIYRPIPYNLKISCGNIYWIDKYQPNVRTQYSTTSYGARGCLGWDMNYFNFDFNAYTANNYRDACPIKLILIE